VPAVHLEAAFADARQRGDVCFAQAPRPKHGDDEGIRAGGHHAALLWRWQ